MGATTFSNLVKGTTAREAFDHAVEEARHEFGHVYDSGTIGTKSSFVLLTQTPVSPDEAFALANAELDRDDSRFHDKGGPAACIPVVTGMRTITVENITGTLKDSEAAIRAAVTEQRLLRKGESIESARLYSYTQAQRPNMAPRYYGSSGYSAPVRFTQGRAEVVIRTPSAPTKRTVTVTATVRGSHTTEQAQEAVTAALAASRNRCKDRETVTRIVLEPTDARAERTFRTAAVAPKGKTVTRYVVSGTRHATWATGLESQAEARAVAVSAAERAPQSIWDAGEVCFEVSGVTRREDGSPLVSVTRSLVKAVYTAQVTITHTPPTTGAPDAWLFFGWAPS